MALSLHSRHSILFGSRIMGGGRPGPGARRRRPQGWEKRKPPRSKPPQSFGFTLGPDRLRAKHMNENGPRNPLMIHTSHHQRNMTWRRWRAHACRGDAVWHQFGIDRVTERSMRIQQQREKAGETTWGAIGRTSIARLCAGIRRCCLPIADHLQQVHAPILLRYCADIDRISAGKNGHRYCLKLCRN